MKPKVVVTMHQDFKGRCEGDPAIHVMMNGKYQKLSDEGRAKFLQKLCQKPGAFLLRVTNYGICESVLSAFAKQGLEIRYPHWHSTGIEKDLPSEEIVKAMAALPDKQFRLYRPLSANVTKLKELVARRDVLIDIRKVQLQKLDSVAKRYGVDPEHQPTWLKEAYAHIAEDHAASQKASSETVKLDLQIDKLASKIPACQVLHTVMKQKVAWKTEAKVIAILGDPSRFPRVSSLWHYSGFHVVNGKSAKPTRGQAMDWNPTLKSCLRMWAENSIIKAKNVRWSPVFNAYKEEELQRGTPVGHSINRALRRVIKDVLCEFFVEYQKLAVEKV